MQYTVLGTGEWGTAFAFLIAQKDDVLLWGHDKKIVKRIQFDRENDRYFPGVELPYEIRATYDLNHAVENCDILIFAVASHNYQEILDEVIEYLPNIEAIITLPTGFDPSSGRRMSQEYLERMETLDNFFVLSGPVLPREIIDEQPSTGILAGQESHNRDRICSSLYGSFFRLFKSDDLIGAETFNSVKTVIGFLAGLSDGLGFSDGARSTLLIRGIHEARKILEFEGGNPDSINQLEGLGSVLIESTSESSPNYWLGRQIGNGQTLEETRPDIQGYIDCVGNSQAIRQRILKGEIKAPLLSSVYRIIHSDTEGFEAIDRILNLDYPPGDQ